MNGNIILRKRYWQSCIAGVSKGSFRAIACPAIIAKLVVAVSAALPSIQANTSNLLPNTPNQPIQLTVQGTDAISGEDLNFQINDATFGPLFTNIDLFTGTIVANNHLDNTGPGISASGTTSGRLGIYSITTAPLSTVIADGLLATVYVSTGTAGTFTLNLLDTVNGTSSFYQPNQSNSLVPLSFLYPHNKFSVGSAIREWTVNGGGSWNTDSHWTPFAPYAQGDIANFAGALTGGSASITLDGAQTVGTLIFNNSQGSYSLLPGSGGILLLNNGTQSPSIYTLAGLHTIIAPIMLAGNTSVSVGGSSTLTISGGISGASSALSLSGGGKLIITGTNNGYGTTNIAALSTLQLGAGGDSVSLGMGPITNDGFLLIPPGTHAFITTPVSGFGNVTINGSVVSINNTYVQPLTTITPTGVMQIGDTAGWLASGTVINDGQLVFNRSDDVNHLSSISGTGSLSQIGSATTTLSAYQGSGAIIVNAGILVIAATGGARQTSAVLLRAASVAVAGGTALDISNHDMMIPNSSFTSIHDAVKNGTGLGNVGGPRITSITANTNPNSNTTLVAFSADEVLGNGSPGSAIGAQYPTYTDNVAVTQPNTTIVKYAYYSDVDFSGSVDGGDLVAVLGKLNSTTPGLANTGLSWISGDVDFSGAVDGGDLVQVLGALGTGSGGLQGDPLGNLEVPPRVPGINVPFVVPEPDSLLFLGLGIAIVSQIRNRSKRRNFVA